MHEDRVSGISLRDVRDSFIAIEDDLPVHARLVVYLVRPEKARPTLWVKAQACDGEGRPLSSVPGHGLGWPHPDFKTFAALAHFLLEHVYNQVDYQLTLLPADDSAERA